MRKKLIAALLMACGMASAQELTYVPYSENGYLTGSTISNNGRYVGGGDRGGQAFIVDMTTGELKYFASPNVFEEGDDDVAASVCFITDEGVGVGYLEGSATRFDFATGEYTKLRDDLSTINYTSQDGAFMCGYTYNEAYITNPCWWKDGVMKQLPQPAANRFDFGTNGASVVAASADGRTIIGYIVDDFATNPLLVWHLDKGDSTYSVEPICKNWFDGTFNLDGRQPYDYFEGAAISANGKWIALNLHVKDPDWTLNTGMTMARYNVETDSLQLLDCPDADGDIYYYATGIANDGTVVGYIEESGYMRTAVICPSGETEVETMSDAYPEIPAIAIMDENSMNTPCAITPDGRYIVGFGYANLTEDDLCFATWRIDTQSNATGVESVETKKETSDAAISTYSIDGTKVNRAKARGVLIEKMGNGAARKVVRR